MYLTCCLTYLLILSIINSYDFKTLSSLNQMRKNGEINAKSLSHIKISIEFRGKEYSSCLYRIVHEVILSTQ